MALSLVGKGINTLLAYNNLEPLPVEPKTLAKLKIVEIGNLLLRVLNSMDKLTLP